MLREGRFILPVMDNNGVPTFNAINNAISALIDAFGGATVTEGRGFWRKPNSTEVFSDEVYTVDVALPDEQSKFQQFVAIATQAGIHANQESIYIRLPNGEVTIPSIRPLVQEAAA